MRISSRILAIWLLAGAVALPCSAQGRPGRGPRTDPASQRFEIEGPAIGRPLPDLTLHDGEGKSIALSQLPAEQYTVLVLGCLTCPPFLRNVPGLETVALDYAPRGVRFFYVYQALAHPEYDGYIKPFTLEERLLHLAEAQRRLGSSIPWLADGMDNSLKAALAHVDNGELLLGPDGKVLVRRAWSDPQALREDLVRIVGPIENPTQVGDLDLKIAPPPQAVATGIVPRVAVTELMRPLIVEPVFDAEKKQVFFVKLRAEASPGLLDEGSGTLYLGFHLDPLHEVHWNNRAQPLEFELTLPRATSADPARGKAPKIDQAADVDPREFLVQVEADDVDAPLELTVNYYACDNAQTFCVPVRQHYRVRLELDPFGGRVLGRGGRGGGGIARRKSHRGPGIPRAAGGRGTLFERLMRMDANGDGKIEAGEVPESMKSRLARMDVDGDGVVDADEVRAMTDRVLQRRRDEAAQK